MAGPKQSCENVACRQRENVTSMQRRAWATFIFCIALLYRAQTVLAIQAPQAQPSSTPVEPPTALQQPSDQLEINADTGSSQGGVTIYEGYVDIRYGSMRLQCDRAIYDESTDEVQAIGNVVFDQENQRITGSRAQFNLRTRKGTIWDARGFTDRTPDGVMMFFEADRIERTGLSRFEIINGRITSCEEPLPKWSFSASQSTLILNKRVALRSPTLKLKNVPVFWLPYATFPIAKRTRQSGFLTPSIGNSNVRGRSLTIPYYQTLGLSADLLSRFDLFTQRGIGFGTDFRSRNSETSYLNAGFFSVYDRLFGQPGPKQGGTAFYLDAQQQLPQGFRLVADVNLVTNLAFRQIFSDSFEQAISPEERTQIYVNNHFGPYSFNVLMQSRDVFLGRGADGSQPLIQPDQLITIRQLPSFELMRRPAKLTKRLPVYLSFRTAAEGVSRGEASFQTPSVVQRLDAQPRITIPLPSLAGMAITPSLTLRSTFYSNSQDPLNRARILSQDVTRTYLDFTVDARPPALERVFYHRDGSHWFKHVIEPMITYRRITGIGSDFARIIRFDAHDAIANTNQVEFALVNRFLIKREGPEGQKNQPHEWLMVKLAQQYFFDPTFGGALRAGQRNQFDPINLLSGFHTISPDRRFSPINLNVRLRPLSSLFADVRLDYDPTIKTLRNTSVTGGVRASFISFSQTWFLSRQTRSVAGTFPGNLYQSSLFLGREDRGPFIGFDLIYDFTNRVINNRPISGRLVTSVIGFGYAFDCCSFQVHNTTYKIGLRNENRLALSLTLFGIGSFGRHTDAGRRIFGTTWDIPRP